MDYARVIRFVREQPWAILPEYVAVITDLLRFRAGGGVLTPDQIRARVGTKPQAARHRYYDPSTEEYYQERVDLETGASLGYLAVGSGQPLRSKGGLVSIIAVRGVISQRAELMEEMSGGTSTEKLTRDFRAALGDQAVGAIALDVDSPGGGVYGVPELGDEIREARGQKPIYGIANSQAASAAYWLLSQVDPGRAYITPSGDAGSIGVYSAHEDYSQWLEQNGIKVTLVSHGKNKTAGNPFEPLSDAAREDIQARVDEYGRMFEQAVAKGRGVSATKVAKDFGQGRMFLAKEAVELGLVDKVGTLDDVVRKASGRSSSAPANAAQDEHLRAVHAATLSKAKTL